MQNRFGLKDFVLFVLVGVLALSIWMRMFQQDREWRKSESVLSKLSSLESQVARLENKLDTGVVVAGGSGPSSTSGPAPTDGKPAANGGSGGDSSWARPGVKIEWQPPWGPATDPFKQPGVQVGGEFTEVYEAQMARLTPFIASDVYARRLHEFVFSTLAVYDPVTLKMRGQLAEAWQVDPNGLWLRARLRPGLRFSDGKPLTAEDIRWTFHEFMMNEEIEAERSRSIYRDCIAKVTPIDDRTVDFEFKERLFTNVDNALGLFVLPKHIYSQFSPADINRGTGLMVGSGPFRLRDFDPNRQWAPPADVVLERNEQYWGPKPPLATIRFKSIQDETARLNAFKRGDADMITPASTQFVTLSGDPEWKDRARFLNWVNMRSGYSFIAWNCGERAGKLTPFHDKRVRLAMTYMLDREKMIRDIWSGVGQVAKGNQPLGSPGSNQSIQPWPYDLAKSRQLLKEAGWEDRNGDGLIEDARGNAFEWEFSFASGGEIALKIANFVKDSAAVVGIRVKLRPADWSVYQDFMKLRDFDSITLGWGASSPESDPRQIFHSDAIKNQGDNFAQWKNEEADRLIDEGRREMDAAKRGLIWQRLEAVLHEDQPYTFIRVPPWLRLVNPEVKNVNPYPKGLEHPEFFRGGPQSPRPAN